MSIWGEFVALLERGISSLGEEWGALAAQIADLQAAVDALNAAVGELGMGAIVLPDME